MDKRRFFEVEKRTLILIAGLVWLIAGFNISRLGILAYGQLGSVALTDCLLSAAVFLAFGLMFYKMSQKHLKRITGREEKYRPFWIFFDLKSYLIMTFMMSGGIWLRASRIAPDQFIAIFYTGLGLALALAGLVLLLAFLKEKKGRTADAQADPR